MTLVIAAVGRESSEPSRCFRRLRIRGPFDLGNAADTSRTSVRPWLHGVSVRDAADGAGSIALEGLAVQGRSAAGSRHSRRRHAEGGRRGLGYSRRARVRSTLEGMRPCVSCRTVAGRRTLLPCCSPAIAGSEIAGDGTDGARIRRRRGCELSAFTFCGRFTTSPAKEDGRRTTFSITACTRICIYP